VDEETQTMVCLALGTVIGTVGFIVLAQYVEIPNLFDVLNALWRGVRQWFPVLKYLCLMNVSATHIG